MSTAPSRVRERREAIGETNSYCDGSLAEIAGEARLRLRRWKASEWMGSLAFAESYCNPPAQRVSYRTGSDGDIGEACFYREERWAGVFKSIAVACRVDPSSEILRRLLRARAADLVRVPLLTIRSAPQLCDEEVAIHFRRSGDDYCIELPASGEEYLSRLGSTTRKHLPYYLRRLKKEWGKDLRVEQSFGREITKESYCDLLALNRLRMDRKRKKSLWTEGLAEHRWGLARECGSLESIYHKERLVAGTLSFVYGKEAFLTVIAHDPEQDRLNLGNACLWLTIQDLIAQGFSRYHLLWGNSPYKEQFGAAAHPLYEMTLFLNPVAARVSRVSELLRVEQIWGLSKSVTQKLAWFFSASRRVSSRHGASR
jgi:hypothetical protein